MNLEPIVHIKSELIVPASPVIIERMVQSDDVKSAFARRLHEALDGADVAKHGRASWLARKMDVSAKAASKWLNGETLPDSWRIAGLADAVGVRAEWLQFGVLPKTAMPTSSKQNEFEWIGGFDPWDSDTPLGDDEVELPLFREVELAAGMGSTQVIENHGCKLRFSKSTLRRAQVDPLMAACATLTGNSMEPVMPDGTTVGVDTSKTTVKDGDIYAIDHGGMLRIKQVYRLPGGLRLRSFNRPEHEDVDLIGEKMHDVRVIGRVFWWSVLSF